MMRTWTLTASEPMSVDVDTVIDILMTCGVDVVDARRRARQITRENLGDVIAGALRECPTIIEAYGRGSIVERANFHRRDLDDKGLAAMDVRT